MPLQGLFGRSIAFYISAGWLSIYFCIGGIPEQTVQKSPGLSGLTAGIEPPILCRRIFVGNIFFQVGRPVLKWTDSAGSSGKESSMSQAVKIKGNKRIQTWVVHHTCRNHCLHCFLGGPSSEDDLLEKTGEMCTRLQSAGFDAQIYATDQTGDDFSRLADIAGRRLPNIQVHTGNLEDNRQDLSETVSLTLMSREAGPHDLITSKGNHSRTLKIIDQLRQRRKSFEVWSCLFSENYEHLPEFFDFISGLGASRIYLNKLIFLGSAMELPKEYFLTTDQIKIVLKQVLGLLRRYRQKGLDIRLQPSWGPLFTSFEQSLYRFGRIFSKRKFCPGGRQSFGIDPTNGGVWSCVYAAKVDPVKIGHVDENGDIVVTAEWPFESDKIGEPCRSCEILPACGGGCRGTAIVEHLIAKGELDHLAGFANCPVKLGIEVPGSLIGSGKAVLSFFRQGGISPHTPL
jgi:radical SAM protein with 4Fe4S-binding SPASM domain